MRTWATCKPQKNSPARTHCSATILSQKMAAHEGAFMSLFTRQSGGQRVLPSQDSEDTQQQFSRARPRSIKAFYRLSTRDVTHVRKCTRPSPALPYWKRREAGRGPGNEAKYMYSQLFHFMPRCFKMAISKHLPEQPYLLSQCQYCSRWRRPTYGK